VFGKSKNLAAEFGDRVDFSEVFMNLTRQFKKIIMAVAGMAMAVLMLAITQPVHASADTFRYGRSTLTSAQQTLYDNIKIEAEKIRTSQDFLTRTYTFGKNEYLLSAKGPSSLSNDDIIQVYNVFAFEEPLYYFLGGSYAYSNDGNNSYINIKMKDYYLNADVRKTTQAHINHFRDMWLEKVNAVYNDSDTSDDLTDDAYEIARILHDLIIEHVNYTESEASSHDIGGVFTGDGAVCEGYAKAYKYMLDLAGIDNILVKGDGSGDGNSWEAHGWNAVKIGGKYYLVDVTWDDLNPDSSTESTPQAFYDYFCMKSSTFDDTHRVESADEYFAMPDFADTNDYSYYVKYKSYSSAKLTQGTAAAFASEAASAAPGPFVYFTVPDTASIGMLIQYSDLSPTPNNQYRSSAFGYLNIWYNPAKSVDTEPDTWSYDPNENVSVTEPAACTPSGSTSSSSSNTGTVTVAGTEGTAKTIWLKGSKDYSKVTLQTTVKATTYKDAKGKTKKGKLGFIVLSEDTGVTFDKSKHKITDKADKGVASVSSKGVVSAKGPGVVYVYAYDTGSFTVERFEITVLVAPTKLLLVYYPGSEEKEDLVKKDSICPGDDLTVYITEQAGSNEVDTSATYSVILKGDSSVSASEVERDGSGVPSFTLTASDRPASATKVSKVKVTVVNDQNGKKANLTVSVGNPVISVSTTGSGAIHEKGDKVDLTLKFDTPYAHGLETTDTVKAYAVLSEPDVDGKKITVVKATGFKVKFNKKTGILTITCSKDLGKGGMVYLSLKDKGSGYIRVIKICTVTPNGEISIA